MTIDDLSKGVGVAGSVLGMFSGNTRRKQQMSDQKELMDKQKENQMALNREQQKIELENWRATNYAAQRSEMEKAGLNPGLMYGGSGGGGMVMDSGTGGGASGGNAPTQQNDMGIMGIQLAQLQSQVELNKALANKANAEATKTGGVDTELAGANKALTEMNTKNAEVINQRESRSLEDGLDTIKANRDKAVAESAKASTEADVSATTKQAQIEKINSEAKNEAFKLAVMKSGIELNDAQMQNMLEQIKIGKFNAEKIGLDQVKGKALNQVYEKVMKYFGVDNKAMK
jgi:hypothetical protein